MSATTDKAVDAATNVLLQLINTATEGVNSAVAFSKSQLPDVIHQLLTYHFATSLIIFTICIVYVVAWVSILITAVVNAWDNDGLFAIFLFGGVLALIAIISAFNYTDWLEIWLAPKVYLLEYAKGLLS